MAYIFDPLRNTFIDDEDTSLGNKLALVDAEFQKLLDIPGVFKASEAPQPPERPDVQESLKLMQRNIRSGIRDHDASVYLHNKLIHKLFTNARKKAWAKIRALSNVQELIQTQRSKQIQEKQITRRSRNAAEVLSMYK